MLKSFLLFLVLFFLNACSQSCVKLEHVIKKECDYYALRSAECLNTQSLIKRLEPYPVIFVGDHHSEANMHLKVAELITALANNGTKVLLANEWFYPSDKKVLNAFVRNDINESEFITKIQWAKRLKYYPYESFKPMYESVKQRGGELYGINISKSEQKQISDDNTSSMNQEIFSLYKALDTNVSAHQNLVMPFLSHCHAPKKEESLKECTQRMYKVQVAWDTKMARESANLARHLKKNEKLIVFAGSMHMEYHLGIPLRFARESNLPYLNIIPAATGTKSIPHGIGDFILFYQAKE